jgi:lipoprotein-anchoring transpeptidase ErfK/SrfK
MESNTPVDAETQVIPAVSTAVPALEIPVVHEGDKVAKRSHKGLFIGLGVGGALVLLVLAAFCVGKFYFADRAPLGTSFAGTSVAGKTHDELNSIVSAKVEDTKFVVATSGGTSTETGYKDLGVTANVEATVSKLLAAQGSNAFAKVNPFAHSDVALVAKSDSGALQTYLNSKLVSDDSQVVLPGIKYDTVTKSFLTTPGKSGETVDADTVGKAVTASLTTATSADSPVKIDTTLTEEKPAVSDEAASTAAKEANRRLLHTFTVTNGSQKTFTIPATKVAEWTKASANTDDGTIDLSYDTDAIKSYLEETLPDALAQKKIDQENLVTPAGRQLMVKKAGADGIEVKDVSTAVTQVSDALSASKDVTAKVTTTVTKHTTKNVEVPHDYDKANGSKWIRVNLSTQTVTAYKGTTVVKSFPVATGQYTSDGGKLTDSGTFYVYLKYNTQTMRGADYVTPNVRWISYFNGGEGFHSAPWNPTNIAIGRASSHGCINMNPSAAKWIYDWAVVGTKVQVSGSTSASAVRASSARTSSSSSNATKLATTTKKK